MRGRTMVAALSAALLATACGGGNAADSGSASATGSGSASATGSGSASATGSGSASATGSGSASASGSASGTHAASGSGAHGEVACEEVGDPASAATTVNVALQEWAVLPQAQEAAAGTVAFQASNNGEMPHELVVIRTETPAAELPTGEDGAVVEDEIDGEVIGEIEPFPAGENCAGAFDLEPGHYALICNIVDEHDGERHVHYALGMRTDFTITE